MSDVIGKGVIEVSADSRKLNAGIDEAKRSLKSLGIAAGDATKSQSQSIDRYIKSLGVAAVTTGKTARELELYKLALRGATAEQLKAADSALKMTEGFARGEAIGARVRTGMIAMGAAATAAALGFGAMIAQSIEAADNINDLSKKTGVSVEDLSGLALAAKQSGSDLDGVAASVAKLSQNIGKDPERFRKLGISAKEPMEAFKQLADIFAAIDDPQTQAALGSEALGKSWQSAAPLLSEGGKAIGEMVEKGKKLSGVTQQLASDADTFNDQLAEMKAAAAGIGMKMAGEMLPAFTDITKAIMFAYEESGKLAALWTAMGSIGAFLFTDEFASTKTKVRELNEEIELLEMHKANNNLINDMLFGSNNDIIGKIEAIKVKIRDLQKSTIPKAPEPKSAPDPKVTKGVAGFIAGDAKDKKDTAAQEAKAQLALDLENIKITSDKLISNYVNAEKLLEAMRSADLVNERDYYAAKQSFLNLNGTAQEKALADEIARMEQEKLLGKDKIALEKKIAETRAKLETTKTANVASGGILTIQSESASTKRNTEVDKFFAEAQAAAEVRNIANVESIRQSLLTQQQMENEAYILRINELVTFRDARMENEREGNRLIEEETERHLNAMNEMQAYNNASSIAMVARTSDQIYDLLVRAGAQKTALGKTLFLATKALAVAEILINTEVAAAKAGAQLGIFGIPMATMIRATGYASAGLVAGMAIAEASAKDGYDIPEGKNPIVQTHAKEMILPRGEANVIRDLARDGGPKGGSGAITIVNNTSAKIGKVTEQRLSNGERALIIEEASHLAESRINASMSDPNSKTSRSMSRNFTMQRSR